MPPTRYSLDQTLNASKMLDWAYRVENAPGNFPPEDVVKSAAILYYYDKWRTAVAVAREFVKLSEE